MNRGGRLKDNNDVLDVAEALAPTYGSAVNAVANMVRQSPEYKRTINRLRRRPRDTQPRD